MPSTKTDRIISSLIDKPSRKHQRIGFGLIVRFGIQAWKGNHWKTHQTVMQANTLLLNILELQHPMYVSRSTNGCEAVFEESTALVQAAILLHSCIRNRSIPATIVLYKDHGHSEPNIWISSIERQAEYVALWSMKDIIVMSTLKGDIDLPVGVGMLPASKEIQQKCEMSLWVLQVYQDE